MAGVRVCRRSGGRNAGSTVVTIGDSAPATCRTDRRQPQHVPDQRRGLGHGSGERRRLHRGHLLRDPAGRSALLLVDFAALASGAGFLVLGMLPFPWLKRWWGTHHLYACSAIANRVIFSRRHGPLIAVLSVLVHVLAVVIAWCCAMAIHASVSFWQVFLLIPPIMLITMLPISIAGWGVREASMTVAFGYAGLMTSEGTVVSILFGIVYFIVGAMGGLIWVSSPEKHDKATAVIPRLD